MQYGMNAELSSLNDVCESNMNARIQESKLILYA